MIHASSIVDIIVHIAYVLPDYGICAAGGGLPGTGTGQGSNNPEIAEATSVPVDYLAKVMRSLVRAGLVRAQRGNTGGFVLAAAGGATSVLDVVNAVDPIRRIKGCPLGLARHREHLCPLHKKLDESMAVIEKDFEATCLSDLAEAPAVMSVAAVAGGNDAE